MDPCCIAIESNLFTNFSGRMCDDPFRFDWRSVHNRTFSAGVAPLPTRLFGVVLFPLLRFFGSSLLTAFLASRGFSDRLVARLIRPPMSHLSCVMLTPRLGHDAAAKQCRLEKKAKKAAPCPARALPWHVRSLSSNSTHQENRLVKSCALPQVQPRTEEGDFAPWPQSPCSEVGLGSTEGGEHLAPCPRCTAVP